MKENEAKAVAAFERIKGVKIDEVAIRSHVLRPKNVVGVISDRGREDAPAIAHIPPNPGFIYELDVNGFIQALETALNNSSAGYSLWLRQNGSTIAAADLSCAKEPQELVLLVNSPVTSMDSFLYTIVSNAYTGNIVERAVLEY
jgi:hypothetical protein